MTTLRPQTDTLSAGFRTLEGLNEITSVGQKKELHHGNKSSPRG
jgi:hypothetical protein